MPAKRELSMRHMRQMLRLHHEGVSAREIGRWLGAARCVRAGALSRLLARMERAMEDMLRYLDEIVEPTIKDFEETSYLGLARFFGLCRNIPRD